MEHGLHDIAGVIDLKEPKYHEDDVEDYQGKWINIYFLNNGNSWFSLRGSTDTEEESIHRGNLWMDEDNPCRPLSIDDRKACKKPDAVFKDVSHFITMPIDDT